MDGMGKVHVPHASCATTADTHRRRGARCQSDLRPYAGARPFSQRVGLTRAAFLSARNDAAANIAIIGAGLLTAYTLSAWPDLIVGLAIAAMNAGAAREVWSAARRSTEQLGHSRPGSGPILHRLRELPCPLWVNSGPMRDVPR